MCDYLPISLIQSIEIGVVSTTNTERETNTSTVIIKGSRATNLERIRELLSVLFGECPDLRNDGTISCPCHLSAVQCRMNLKASQYDRKAANDSESCHAESGLDNGPDR